MSHLILSEHKREEIKSLLVPELAWMLANPAKVVYTEDYWLRWEPIRTGARIVDHEHLHHGDCSSTYAWLAKNTLSHVGHNADTINGLQWTGGFTGTMIGHGRIVHDPRHIRFGDAVFFGSDAHGNPTHVAWALSSSLLFNHGSPGGPFKVSLYYRNDRWGVRRYW